MVWITGVHAASGAQLFKHWWQWLLVAFWIFSIVLGLGFILVSLVNRLRTYLQRKPKTSGALSKKVELHLRKFLTSASQLSIEKLDRKKPASLGVYMGPFEPNNFAALKRILSVRDFIILDPNQPNIVPFLTDLLESAGRPKYVVGRLDIGPLLKPASNARHSEKVFITCIDGILAAISSKLRDEKGRYNGFTGVLLADWDFLPASVLHELGNVIVNMGLEVYLEASAPEFIKDSEILASPSISGLVIRNGILHGDGERQDCFDMEALHATVKGFVTQSCIREFTVLAWEALDDSVALSHAVLKRTFGWCKFYNVLPWIGSEVALFDASVDAVAFEPLSAFAWLKEPRVMELHDMWKSQQPVKTANHRHSVLGRLTAIVPSIRTAQAECSCAHDNWPGEAAENPFDDMEWFGLRDAVICDPICMSAVGNTYNELGCFPLGLDLTLEDHQEIIFSQRNLRKLDLLDTVSAADLREYGILLASFSDSDQLSSDLYESDLSQTQVAIEELAATLEASQDDVVEGVRVFLGLHSGFQRTPEKQFWAVAHLHSADIVDIYISKTVQDVIGTLLHTYLSARGLTRRQCLSAEIAFSRWNKTLNEFNLSPRIAQDIDLLTPEESLQLLQRLSRAPESERDPLILGLNAAIHDKLVALPVRNQLKANNTIGFLSGDVSAEEMIKTRLDWHCQSKRQHPTLEGGMLIFREVEATIISALNNRNHQSFQTIADSLGRLLNNSKVSAIGDLFALSVFSVMRKLAFEEIYIEVTDRNPLFNNQSDQAAAFAELFALGSRCQAFFDVTPSQFGELLINKFNDHYSKPEHQPPKFVETSAGLPTAYAEAQIDVDPNYKSKGIPGFKQFTFMSVFAIPALIDILLLTTTGHGLYLSGLKEGHDFMTQEEQHSATTALMISLLLSGAIGTWISCGGTYYLSSMAFSAMNYFVVTRLLGGFAFTLIVGVVGFIAFICTSNFHAAIVFFLYLIVLTTYLSLLAALANYQFIGSDFLSGRSVIICCIPILFISPITTIFFTGYDIIIYLATLYVFVFSLLLGVRYTGSRWTTWFQKLALVNDSQLREWYLGKKTPTNKDGLEKMSDPAILRFARQALLQEVLAEEKKGFFAKKTQDPLVAKLAKSAKATDFLMNWYCRFSGVAKPIIFSSAWNVQTKVALFSLQKSQLGIKFHSGFLHWRQAGDEIGCTMLYFILALLDKWVALIDGGLLVGLTNANTNLTLPVGFGLAYYLVGAVLLDFNGHKLHQLASKTTESDVPTDLDIAAAAIAKCKDRRKLYWGTLFRFMCWHVWGLAFTTTLIWLFSSNVSSQATIIFFGYVASYTGLLWYQYTKIFSGPHALKPLLVGVILGLILGFSLDHGLPGSVYSDIIALGVACWTVAILSLWGAKIIGPPDDRPRPQKLAGGVYHSYSGPGPDHAWSQAELQSLYDELSEVPLKERLPVDPDSDFGVQVKLILDQASYSNLSELAQRAFPDAEALMSLTKRLFRERFIQVELLSVAHFPESDKAMRAISFLQEASVQVRVSCETKQIPKNEDPLLGFYWDVAELLVQIVAERYLSYTPKDAILSQNILYNSNVWNNGIAGPDVLERQLRLYTRNNALRNHMGQLRRDILLDLCLGFDFNAEYETLPEDVRKFLINRCLGKSTKLTAEQSALLNKKVNHTVGLDFETHLARRDYAAFLGARILNLASSRDHIDNQPGSYVKEAQDHEKLPQQGLSPVPWATVSNLLEHTPPPKYTAWDKFLKYSGAVYHYFGTLCKFFSIAFVADPEFQRELRYTFPGNNQILHSVTRFFLLTIWMWAKGIQSLLLPSFLFYRRPGVVTTWKNIQGMEVSIKRRRVVIRSSEGIMTGFIHDVDGDNFRLLQYKGEHKTEPTTKTALVAINMYSRDMALLRRVEMSNGNTVNDYIYSYRNHDPRASKRLSKTDLLSSPITRKGVAGTNALQNVSYNLKGQIDSGSYMKDGNMVRFQYHYQKSTRHEGALLRAEFVLPHLSCTVSWCAPPRRKPERLETWIPHSQVTEATFVVGPDVWESKYFYDHKFHPTIVTTLNGQRVDTPALILYDHLDVLKRPTHVSFLHDNPLYGFKSIQTWAVTRWLNLHTRKYPVSTPEARSLLWQAWKNNSSFDGVIARWLDERLLRREPVLRPYWRKRDFCKLEAAEVYLDKNRDAVMASVDLDNTVSSWTPLAMKINDFYSFGQGGDACGMTRSNLIAQEDDETALHVIAIDTGTWPNEGGGVTACRSDVINNLRTIKWHMVAESANDFGIPKRQIERNIHSLKIIPLWGLDLLTPTHGLFSNRLDSEVDHLTTHTTLLDIQRNFLPILNALISGARAIDFTGADVKQVTRALVNLNAYFEDCRDWSAVWQSAVVKSAWRQMWLSQTAVNTRPSAQWLRTEIPTLGQLDQGLELWSRYLFIFSIPIPDKMPPLFQASHHSVSASYGVVCKLKRGCTLQIWDHAISWRETNLYMSSALCPLAPFVRNSLLGLMRMTSVVTLHHADTLLPCADFFNPNWEIEIGTCQGKIENRSLFKRKIDPVVNGITHMERFTPVKEIKTTIPTVTMLSHIWYAKDIKTALLSADIIVNEFGFKDFKLEIYGAIDKTPSYTTNCQEIIASKSLRENVQLMGEADPIYVLERTWVFLNSSISEGLPLALGEAALTGAPVVCTDVGASLRVLTNPTDGSCYSAVVAPNDALAMARAQIKLLALLEEWAPYSDPTKASSVTLDASFPEKPTVQDVRRITRRMYEQSDARRALGMRTREIVQKSFSGDRYLREHEQMLWVGKAMRDMKQPHSLRPSNRNYSPAPVQILDLPGSIFQQQRDPALHSQKTSMNNVSIGQGKRESSQMQTDMSVPSLSMARGSYNTSFRTGTDVVPSLMTGVQVGLGEQEWVGGLKVDGRVSVHVVNSHSRVNSEGVSTLGSSHGRRESPLVSEIV